jgi:hypothetical protein
VVSDAVPIAQGDVGGNGVAHGTKRRAAAVVINQINQVRARACVQVRVYDVRCSRR